MYTVGISGEDVCCSVVFGTLVGVFVFSVMWSELLMTSAICCPLSVVRSLLLFAMFRFVVKSVKVPVVEVDELSNRSTGYHHRSPCDNSVECALQANTCGSNVLGIHVVELSGNKRCLKIIITFILTVCCSSQRVFCLGSVRSG